MVTGINAKIKDLYEMALKTGKHYKTYNIYSVILLFSTMVLARF